MLQAIYAKDLAVAIILLFVVLIYTFFAYLESKAETHEKGERVISGVICEIIIKGQRAQANTRYALEGQTGGAEWYAQQLIAGFEALCELGTTVYDGNEVMTDDQQKQATVIMGAYNDAIEPMVTSVPYNPRHLSDLITSTMAQVNRLLDQVLANT